MSDQHYLNFEKHISDLENRLEGLRSIAVEHGEVGLDDELSALRVKLDKALRALYKQLSPWQKVQVARHENRPYFLDYVQALFQDYFCLSGDRCFADDEAIQGGIASFQGLPCVVMGNQKGRDLHSRVMYNFGMARPEGYRKAVRLMQLADKFSLPVITFVDTAGAYPGADAEERGQAQAIALSIETCLSIHVPIISFITGEGGSGGAVALASADKVWMLEHSVYSVISPEGCASILWHDAGRAETAAEQLHLTAEDLKRFGVIDGIIPEPVGGAHRDYDFVFKKVGEVLKQSLQSLSEREPKTLLALRRKKFLEMDGRVVF